MPHDDSRLNVLLIEDNDIDIEITRRAVARSRARLQLQIARDGSEALDTLLAPAAARAATLRAIFLDLRLPGTDGLEVLRRIKTHPSLCIIPVVVLTGDSAERTMLRCVNLGGNMYFIKPITPADVATLASLIEKYWLVMDRLRPSSQGDRPT